MLSLNCVWVAASNFIDYININTEVYIVPELRVGCGILGERGQT